ncbi:predicted protein [Streptomyces albidoflavus]|nr:predicted protein [Streptomyces albidoflavus]
MGRRGAQDRLTGCESPVSRSVFVRQRMVRNRLRGAPEGTLLSGKRRRKE